MNLKQASTSRQDAWMVIIVLVVIVVTWVTVLVQGQHSPAGWQQGEDIGRADEHQAKEAARARAIEAVNDTLTLP